MQAMIQIDIHLDIHPQEKILSLEFYLCNTIYLQSNYEYVICIKK